MRPCHSLEIDALLSPTDSARLHVNQENSSLAINPVMRTTFRKPSFELAVCGHAGPVVAVAVVVVFNVGICVSGDPVAVSKRGSPCPAYMNHAMCIYEDILGEARRRWSDHVNRHRKRD